MNVKVMRPLLETILFNDEISDVENAPLQPTK